MASDKSTKGKNFEKAYSLSEEIPSVYSASEEEETEKECDVTDYGYTHYSSKNERETSSEYNVECGDKELKGKKAISQSEDIKIEEGSDSIKTGMDEEEQYKYLYALNTSASVSIAKPSVMGSVAYDGNNLTSAPSDTILQKRLRETQEELKEQRSRLSKAEEELERKERNAFELQERLCNTQEELEEMKHENKKLKEEAKRGGSARSRNTMEEKMHIKLNQTMGRCKELEKNLQLEQEQVENYRKQLDEMQSQLSEMQFDRQAKTEEQIQQYKMEKAEFEERMQHLQDSLENKSYHLTAETSKCQKYQEDLERKQREMESQREQFNRERGELVQKKDELEQETVRQTHQLKELEKSLSVEKQERNKIHSQVKALLDQNEIYKTHVLNLQQEKEKVEKEALDVCTKFQEEAEKTLLTYDQLREKSDQDSKELLNQRQKITGYMKRMESMRDRINELEADKEKLENNVTTLQDAMLAVKLTADENETGFHAERDARTKDKAMYENKVRQMKMEIEDLNTKLHNMHSKNEALAKDKKNLMEQLNSFAATQCHDTFSS